MEPPSRPVSLVHRHSHALPTSVFEVRQNGHRAAAQTANTLEDCSVGTFIVFPDEYAFEGMVVGLAEEEDPISTSGGAR